MIYEHEIPKDARLYFGSGAKLKRDIEKSASEVFYRYGYEEIVTPLFSYHQHGAVEDTRELVRVSDEENKEIALRADSTIDVIKIITKRLGNTTDHKRWFYIQPVFRYPTKEFYQIGAELLGSSKTDEVLGLALEIFEILSLKPVLQISNIKIPKLLQERYQVPLSVLKSVNVEYLSKEVGGWVESLLYLKSPEQITDLCEEVPSDISDELLKIKELCDSVSYEKIVVAPLFYAKMRYYEDLFFRFFESNLELCLGGEYMADSMEAAGFALYTDNIIEILQKG